MERNQNLRLNSLQLLRGFSAILIVLFHATQLYQSKFNIDYLGGIFKFGFIGVDLFFVISGFILFYSHNKYIGEKSKIKGFLWNRFFRIYPLYWIILFVVTILIFFIPSAGNGNEKELTVLLNNFLLLPQKELYIIPQAWTLKHEILFYLVFAVAIFNKRVFKIIVAIWGSLCLINLTGVFNINIYLGLLFNPLNLEFLMGGMIWFIIYKYKDNISKKYCNLSILLGGILLTSLIIMIQISIPFSRILVGLAFSLILFGVIVRNIKFKSDYNKLLVFLGNASYSIYLTHFTLTSALIIVLQKLGFINPSNLIITLGNVFIIILGIACHIILEKPLSSMFKKLKTITVRNKVETV